MDVVDYQQSTKFRKNHCQSQEITLGRKSQRLLLHFSKVIGFDEVLNELFRFGLCESGKGDNVDPVFLGDGVVSFVFLGEAIDALYEPEVGAADERHLADIRRCRQMVENQQLKVLLQHIAVEAALASHGWWKETVYVFNVNHNP